MDGCCWAQERRPLLCVGSIQTIEGRVVLARRQPSRKRGQKTRSRHSGDVFKIWPVSSAPAVPFRCQPPPTAFATERALPPPQNALRSRGFPRPTNASRLIARPRRFRRRHGRGDARVRPARHASARVQPRRSHRSESGPAGLCAHAGHVSLFFSSQSVALSQCTRSLSVAQSCALSQRIVSLRGIGMFIRWCFARL
jgi:hypothetical protein